MAILKLLNKQTGEYEEVPAISGSPGVYTGTGPPPSWATVWIDPSGTISDAVEIPVTLADGFTGTCTAWYMEHSRLVVMEGRIAGSVPADTHTKVATFPTAYAPASSRYSVPVTGVNAAAQIYVTNTGSISCYLWGATTNVIRFNTSYIVGG